MPDHSPIYCQFHTKDIGTRIEVNNNITMKPSWKKASPQQKSSYMVTLQSRINDLKVTENVKTSCDVHCKQGDHNSANDDFLISLLENVQDVSNAGILSFNEKKTPSIACWDTEVLPFNEKKTPSIACWDTEVLPFNEKKTPSIACWDTEVLPFKDSALF